MPDWLPPAIRYIEQWLAHQMRVTEQPGCVIAISSGSDIVLDRAFGLADLSSKEALSPRHRFRVASHSKSFTAAAVMLLREKGHIKLDDFLGQHIPDLPKPLADATVGQALSHTAGLPREGSECAYWDDLASFPDKRQLLEEISRPLVLNPGERMKYSNLGYGLLGLLVEAVTGESFEAWTAREVISRSGLTETMPDCTVGTCNMLATGYSGKLPIGRRATASGTSTNALTPAAGFVSTARDLVRFFSQLDPVAKDSILSAASRREMTRRHWKSPGSSSENYYGLGVIAGSVEDHDYFGHMGAFYGFQSRTCVLPSLGITVAVLVNAVDGPAGSWVDGAVQILSRFAKAGPPTPEVADWTGRWWNAWGVVDLVPLGDVVLLADPDATTPFSDAPEVSVSSIDRGLIKSASGFGSYGEQVVRVINTGEPQSVIIAGEEHIPEERLVRLYSV